MLCFNDSWIHAFVAIFLIIACGYNLAKEVFQIFDEVCHELINHNMLLNCIFSFIYDSMSEEYERQVPVKSP